MQTTDSPSLQSEEYSRSFATTLRNLQSACWLFFYRRCLVGFPWHWPSRPPCHPAMVEARRTVRRQFGRGRAPAFRVLAKALSIVVWPLAVLIHLWEIRHERGPGAVPIALMPGAFRAAMRHNILPGEYYAYELWRAERHGEIDNYLFSREGIRLFALLDRPAEPDPIKDKLVFHTVCRAHEIPTPAILAAFTPAGVSQDFDSGKPPAHDLFVKPSLGSSGRRAERLRWYGNGFVSDRGHHIDLETVSTYIAARARHEKRTLIIQPFVYNHPSLPIDDDGSLMPLRLITGQTVEGNIEPIVGWIYLTEADRKAPGYRRVALVDVNSGRLCGAPRSHGHGINYGADRFASGLEDLGTLPGWDAALQAIKTAHKACNGRVFVGWDVAFTDHGPVLLEGNTNWCADEFQRVTGRPLGSTVFADILAKQLHRAK